MEEIFQAIREERIRQMRKWGDQSTNSPTTWVTILGEEFGEAAKEVLEGNEGLLITELIQVAAVAVAWLEVLSGLYPSKQTRDTLL